LEESDREINFEGTLFVKEPIFIRGYVTLMLFMLFFVFGVTILMTGWKIVEFGSKLLDVI
jgi:hypothetical protein